MTVDRVLLLEALHLTAKDRDERRTAVQADMLMDKFVAEFVAESESLEGHASKASEVLDASQALAV